MRLTYETMMASSRDAGNMSMRKAGRKVWNIDDWNAAAAVCDRLAPYLIAEQLGCPVAEARARMNPHAPEPL